MSDAVISDMLHAFDDAVAKNQLAVAETLHLRGRPEKLEPVPDSYTRGAVGH